MYELLPICAKEGKTMNPVPVNCINDNNIRITDISWERIFLNLTVESLYEEDLTFSIAKLVFPNDNSDEDNDRETGLKGKLLYEISLEPACKDGNTYTFHLNMSAMDDRSFLDNARWRFITRISSDDDIHICTITYDAAHMLPELSRVFSYGRSKYSYNVWFTTFCGDSVNIVPILNSRFMIENPEWRDRYSISERRTLKGKVNCAVKKSKLSLMQAAYDFYDKKSRKNGRSILFMSETKPYIWGNLKFIDDRLKARGLDKEFDISYTFRQAVGKHNSAGGWMHTVKMLAGKDFIFVDDLVPIFNTLRLSKKTKLIQVWHAGEGFKAVGYSRFGMKSSPHPEGNCHKKYDYAITGSERLVDVYSEAFGLPRKYILPLGMARLDGFLDEATVASKREKFYEAHPELAGKKLILFAPTFRGTGQKHAHYDYEMLDMKKIYEFCGDEYVWMFKMHPFTKNKPDIPAEYSSRILDLDKTHELNDLFYVSDILITDYSSAYFEFALINRPILFYTYDREVYEIVRGVHKDIKQTAPGKVCDTFDELIDALENKDYEFEKTQKFREENFGKYDGKAADRIIDTILLGK